MDRAVAQILAIDAEVRARAAEVSAARAVTRHLIDALGCALAGHREPVAVLARSLAGTATAERPATVLGADAPAPAELAAFANGVLVRCLDLNDTYASASGIGHPSDYIPAVLAAAEETGASVRTALTGIASAYEVFCRLTEATKYHVSGFDHVSNGVVAAAVGAAHAFDLTSEQIGHAVALAAVANLGLHETRVGEVSMWKGAASANACRNGVFAAKLAAMGMTGPPSVFEGRCGIAAVAAPDFNRAELARSTNELAITRCHLKRYPAGFFSQSAIDAAREVYARIGGASGRIRSIRVGTFPFGLSVMAGDREKWSPRTRESADHSLPYLVATALHRGDVTIGDFSPSALADPAIRRLLDTLSVDEDAACAAAWPGESRTDLSVVLDDGRTERVVVGDYYGHHNNPMTDDAVSQKFLAGASTVLGTTSAQRLLQRLWNLDGHEPAATILG